MPVIKGAVGRMQMCPEKAGKANQSQSQTAGAVWPLLQCGALQEDCMDPAPGA